MWNGSGSGCSSFESKPKWQTDTGCSNRTDNDVAAVANPNTGVAIYDTYDQGGWLEVGGTSVSSPIIASVFALAGTPGADNPSGEVHLQEQECPFRRDERKQRLVQPGVSLHR